MSYCRFENTLADMEDCVLALEEIESFSELSAMEQLSVRRMRAIVDEFLHRYQEIQYEESKGRGDIY